MPRGTATPNFFSNSFPDTREFSCLPQTICFQSKSGIVDGTAWSVAVRRSLQARSNHGEHKVLCLCPGVFVVKDFRGGDSK